MFLNVVLAHRKIVYAGFAHVENVFGNENGSGGSLTESGLHGEK